jgi:hypothetical protein
MSETRIRLRALSVDAVVSDAIDASARLIADIAKFGLALTELHVMHESCGFGSLRMRLAVPDDLDVESVSARLARHVSVVSLSWA